MKKRHNHGLQGRRTTNRTQRKRLAVKIDDEDIIRNSIKCKIQTAKLSKRLTFSTTNTPRNEDRVDFRSCLRIPDRLLHNPMTHTVLGEGTPMICYKSSDNISKLLIRAKFYQKDVSYHLALNVQTTPVDDLE